MAGCKTDFLCTLEREVNNAFLPLVTKECHGSERVKHLDLNKLLRKANISTDYAWILSKVAHSNGKTTNVLWENLLTRESCVNTKEYNILHGPGAREWIRKAYTISYLSYYFVISFRAWWPRDLMKRTDLCTESPIWVSSKFVTGRPFALSESDRVKCFIKYRVNSYRDLTSNVP